MLLSYKYRLYPNRAQAEALEGMLQAFRDLYNAGLQQRIEAYRRRGKILRYLEQANELKAVRLADERLAGFSYSAEQQVLRRLDKAFRAFVRRLRDRRGKAGFPRFKGRDRFRTAEFRAGDGLTLRKGGRLGIVGVPGELKVKWHRALPGPPRAAVLTRQAGRWHVVFQVGAEAAEPGSHAGAAVGIDVGLANLVALSTGETVPAPPWTKEAAKGLRRRQRALARCRPRSGVRRKRKLALARYQAKVANRRRDFLHKLTADLARRFGVLVLEELDVARLARTMFAKPILNAAWGMFRGLATYKASRAGGRVEAEDPRGTSQECVCGTPVPKGLGDRFHRCPGCGAVEDRDVMAARVILQRYLLRTGPGTGPGARSEPVAA